MDLSRELPAVDQLRNLDAVFHLAGIAHTRGKPEQYERLNHRVTVDLAHRAERAGVGCFVFLSSVRAMGTGQDDTARNESQNAPPDSPYGLSKWHAECDLRDRFADSSMAIYILRPPLVYGPGAVGNLDVLQRAVSWHLPRPPNGGARSMVAAQDLVELMCALARNPAPGPHTWIVTDGKCYTLVDIYEALRCAAGRGVGKAWLPAGLWYAAVKFFDVLRRSGRESLYQRLFGSDLYDNSALLAATDWRPRYSLHQVINLDAGVQ